MIFISLFDHDLFENRPQPNHATGKQAKAQTPSNCNLASLA
jgi:hypothetical protein